MIRNIKTAIDVVAGAEGYEIASLHASAFESIPIVNSEGKIISGDSECMQVTIVLKKRQQKGDCDEF
ncbi:MAG: hypothetical protein IKB71_07585 [Lentisphaeria bacterium]|nr:hypothetical protein [Lentisphaeria bacterium]